MIYFNDLIQVNTNFNDQKLLDRLEINGDYLDYIYSLDTLYLIDNHDTKPYDSFTQYQNLNIQFNLDTTETYLFDLDFNFLKTDNVLSVLEFVETDTLIITDQNDPLMTTYTLLDLPETYLSMKFFNSSLSTYSLSNHYFFKQIQSYDDGETVTDTYGYQIQNQVDLQNNEFEVVGFIEDTLIENISVNDLPDIYIENLTQNTLIYTSQFQLSEEFSVDPQQLQLSQYVNDIEYLYNVGLFVSDVNLQNQNFLLNFDTINQQFEEKQTQLGTDEFESFLYPFPFNLYEYSQRDQNHKVYISSDRSYQNNDNQLFMYKDEVSLEVDTEITTPQNQMFYNTIMKDDIGQIFNKYEFQNYDFYYGYIQMMNLGYEIDFYLTQKMSEEDTDEYYLDPTMNPNNQLIQFDQTMFNPPVYSPSKRTYRRDKSGERQKIIDSLDNINYRMFIYDINNNKTFLNGSEIQLSLQEFLNQVPQNKTLNIEFPQSNLKTKQENPTLYPKMKISYDSELYEFELQLQQCSKDTDQTVNYDINKTNFSCNVSSNYFNQYYLFYNTQREYVYFMDFTDSTVSQQSENILWLSYMNPYDVNEVPFQIQYRTNKNENP